MMYRIFSLLGLMALTAGSLAQAQDYDDIYYDASKSATTTTKVKAEKPSKTVVVYGDVPEKYQVAAQGNYQLERDEDEYNRRGAYEPEYEVDINGDTIYEDAFANTRRIERFYNPDVVILSDDDDLVELYYDESPSINLIVGSDWSYASYGWSTSYYPWYTGWYEPWYNDWYSPWHYGWYNPWHYGWGRPIYFGYWHSPYYGWWNPGWYVGWRYTYGGWDWPRNHHYADWGRNRPNYDRHSVGGHGTGHRAGLATNRNNHTRDANGGRSGITARGNGGNRASSVGTSGTRSRSGLSTTRSGNMRSRTSSGVTTRNSSASRSSRVGSYSGSSSRSNSSYSSGSSSRSTSRSSGSYSSGSSSRSSGGSYSSGSSGGSRSSGGGGSRGGSSGGGGRRR